MSKVSRLENLFGSRNEPIIDPIRLIVQFIKTYLLKITELSHLPYSVKTPDRSHTSSVRLCYLARTYLTGQLLAPYSFLRVLFKGVL